MFKSNRPDPVAGEVYRHFKGNLYEVVTIAVHTETSDRLVVYKSVDTPGKVFARPVDMFLSDVDRLRYPFIKAKYRFTLVENEKNDVAKIEKTILEDLKDEITPDTNNVEQKPVEEKSDNNNERIVDNNKETQVIENLDTDDTAKYKEDGTLVLDPVVEAILDAKEYTKKIENFQLLRGKCTEEMLTMLAISLDVQLTEGTIDDKYAQILQTLRMHEKYESARLRF